MTEAVPTEDQEQYRFVKWLERRHYKFTSIPNSTYTTSWKQKQHNYFVGLRPGFPDIVVIAENKFIVIEMKRTKKSTTSPEQKAWIDALIAAGVSAKVCKGADEAIAFVKSLVSAPNAEEGL